MALPKGRTNNPTGRPKGTPNKTTSELRQWIINLLSKNRAQVGRDLLAIPDPAERLKILLKFLELVLPKPPQAVAAMIGTDPDPMSRADLLAELERLTKLTEDEAQAAPDRYGEMG